MKCVYQTFSPLTGVMLYFLPLPSSHHNTNSHKLFILVFSTPFSLSRALLVLLALARGVKNESIQQLQQYFLFSTQSSMVNEVETT